MLPQSRSQRKRAALSVSIIWAPSSVPSWVVFLVTGKLFGRAEQVNQRLIPSTQNWPYPDHVCCEWCSASISAYAHTLHIHQGSFWVLIGATLQCSAQNVAW